PGGRLVPWTVPVEGVSAAQARDLAAGRITSWSELGGPAMPIEAQVQAGETVSRVFGALSLTAAQDVGASLAERRGRLVIAPWAPSGSLVKPLRIDGVRPDEPGYPLALRWVVAGRPAEPQSAALARALAARRGASDCAETL